MEAILDEIFKAYDIRGKVGDQLNEEIIYNIGRAFADFLPAERPVAIGFDMRPDSKAFAESFMAGLVKQGRDVWDLGRIATDMIYFAVGANNLAGGAVITASHNPGDYNGIKLCKEEAQPVGEDTGLLIIKDNILNNTYKDVALPGTVTKHELVDDWINHVLTFVDTAKYKPLKIAVDAGNGMAGEIFTEIEPFVPWDVKEMYFEPDGTFPNHEANPLKFETLKDICNEIKKNKLDGGIAFDGDGDRAFLIDETGTPMPASILQALISEYYLKRNKGAKIVHEVRTSRSVSDTITKKGGTLIVTKAGHSNIKQAMREQNAVFGSEASGHYFFKDNWHADSGLIAAMIALYVVSLKNKKLSEIRKEFTLYASINETNFTVSNKDETLEKIKNHYKNEDINELDGVTVSFNNGAWFNLRASNTEPLLRLNAEARNEQDLKAVVDKVTKLISD
jgi:phosphomannomutase